jgi:hypothetical protein
MGTLNLVVACWNVMGLCLKLSWHLKLMKYSWSRVGWLTAKCFRGLRHRQILLTSENDVMARLWIVIAVEFQVSKHSQNWVVSYGDSIAVWLVCVADTKRGFLYSLLRRHDQSVTETEYLLGLSVLRDTMSLLDWSVLRRQCRFLCKTWGFHGGDYEEWCLQGCYAMWLL